MVTLPPKVVQTVIRLGTNPVPFQIRLGLRRRLKAWFHIMPRLFDHQHRIWRVTSHLGLNLHHIFCECGKEFE